MNICFLGGFNGGGTERATLLVANHLAEIEGFNIFILNLNDSALSFSRNHTVEIQSVKSGNLIKRNLYIRKYIRKNDIEVLIAVEAMVGLYALLPTWFTCRRLIIWDHANYYQTQGSRWIKTVRLLDLLFCKNYVVLTKRDKLNFQSHFWKSNKLKQIYNLSPKFNNIQYNIRSKIIVSAGHISHIKNFQCIPELSKPVFEKYPDWEWHIYGSEYDSSCEILKKEITKYRLEKNIILKGRCTDMEKAYASASIFVLTSIYEGYPMVLLEARAYGVPMVSFNIETGPDEIIEEDKTGFLIDNYDKDKMAKRIIYLIENPEIRQKFSNECSGTSFYKSNNQIIEEWISIIRK